MFKAIALSLAAILAVAVVVVLTLAVREPNTFTVARSAAIKAPPEKIFPLINDLHAFATWSPYEKKDPAMKRDFSGAAAGKGAIYDWDGDRNVGKGRLEIADATPPSKVTMKLGMIKPFEANNIVDFTLEPRGETTNVTWAMRGGMPFMAKVVGVFMDMDAMVGKDFEDGLANLKAVAEK